jgi:hypothetical protein
MIVLCDGSSGKPVSEIFISYARPDQVLAQSLADDLKGRGFKVWWDTELFGSDDFYEVIYTALSNAKAAIVIWSKESCRSKFVRDEARFALQREKLIATKASDFNVDDTGAVSARHNARFRQ